MINERAERERGRTYLWGPIYRLLKEKKIRKVLNVGGGMSSEWIDLVGKYNLRLHVVDDYSGDGAPSSNEQLLSHSLATNKINNLVEITKADVISFEFKSNEYDIIYAKNSLHHIIQYNTGSLKHMSDLFFKFHSSLRKGGYVYIQDVGRSWFLNLLQIIRPVSMRKMDYTTKTNLNEYLKVLYDAGFTVLETHYYVPYKLRWFRKFLANETFNPLLKSSFIIFAIKE